MPPGWFSGTSAEIRVVLRVVCVSIVSCRDRGELMAHYSDLDAGVSAASYSVPAAPVASAPGVYENFFKRVLDILIVLLTAPFVLPVVLGLGLLIRRDGGSAF